MGNIVNSSFSKIHQAGHGRQGRAGQGGDLGACCAEQGVPVLQVAPQARGGAHVQVGGLSQGEAGADGPVVHRPLPP